MNTCEIDNGQIESLAKELSVRDEKITSLNKEVCRLNQEAKYLNEQLEWFKRQLFGKRSERVVSDLNEQQLYFEGFENLATKEIEKKLQFHHTNGKSLIEMVKIKSSFLKTCL